jgi:hypothetical protein
MTTYSLIQHKMPQDIMVAARLIQENSVYLGRIEKGAQKGPHVHPRFSAIEVPQVGDEVSYTFNGDYYPDGTVTRVSKSLVITTSEGHRYYRKGASGTWKQTGGTWSLIRGHISERNQEF